MQSMVLPCGLPEPPGCPGTALVPGQRLHLHSCYILAALAITKPIKSHCAGYAALLCAACAACAWYNYLSFSLLPWTAEGIKYTPRSAPVCAPHVLEEQ